jgi:hypothetical protein
VRGYEQTQRKVLTALCDGTSRFRSDLVEAINLSNKSVGSALRRQQKFGAIRMTENPIYEALRIFKGGD